MMAKTPKDFAVAMRDLVERSQLDPATAVSDQAYEMKLRVLDHFIKRDPDPESFERVLMERIRDSDPRKELSRGVCCQILNSWRSGSCRYTTDGRLLLLALYPADRPASVDEGGEHGGSIG